MPHGRVYNFGAGPGSLPLPVLEEVQRTMLNFHGTGMSVMEVSHRSRQFEEMAEKAEKHLRELLYALLIEFTGYTFFFPHSVASRNIPNNYKLLFMQGGGTAQFAAVPLNLIGSRSTADYIITGHWSKKAYDEVCLFMLSSDINR